MTSPPQRCDGGRTTRKRSASSVSEKSPDGGSTTRGDIAKLLGDLPPVDARVVLLYARVSSAKQSGDLERQCTDLRERYPGAELIRDTASGLNFQYHDRSGTHQHRHCPRTCRYPQRQTCSLWS